MSVDVLLETRLSSPTENHPIPVVPGVIPAAIQDEAILGNLQEAVTSHEELSMAAGAVGLTIRPQGDVLLAVQARVGKWLEGNSSEDLSKADVRALFNELYTGHLGTVGLYDLDATVAFARRLWAEEIASRRGVDLPELGKTALEAAPALLYVPPERREQIARGLGLKDEHIATLAPPVVVDAPSEIVATQAGAERTSRQEEALKFGVRDARASDIPAMVEVDMRAFSRVYQAYGMTEDELRADLIRKFNHRYDLLGGKWMPVVTMRDGNGEERIVGLMTGCPTNKTPNEFESWEKTTNHGTLDGLYDPNGKHLYVVTLSMDPSVHGQNGEDQAYMRLMSKMIESRMEYAYFESRMPGFRTWVKKHCRQSELNFDEISENDEALMGLAERYSKLTKTIDGKEVPYDKLLRLYSVGFGCDLTRVVPNAYKDVPSMNFGAVYVFENPLPTNHRGGITSWLVGKSLGLAAKSTSVSQRVMKLLQRLF